MPALSGSAKGLGGFSILQRPRRYILLSSSLRMSVKKNMEKRVTPQQRIAVERMWRLFELAQNEWSIQPQRSRRYIKLIRGFSTRFRVAIPTEIKNSFCKTCENIWEEGVNVKRRIKGNTLNSNCLICNTLTRRKIGDK
ncbi:MAG: hypothetical protein FJY86_04225 [Candidatus Diapherotrites archaeon]|uniref:Ribonuclease P protein component 4 n=1 Tax=Candidatus Iainarchaeum sp. TaxID=3101447 RepID=A0A8T4C7K7_9ARCH|nr:hypothetical protein [Candidatus Diapherotrites archaeon]